MWFSHWQQRSLMPSQAGAGLEFLREATGHPPEGRCWGLQAFSQSSWAAVLGAGGLVSSDYLGCTGTCGGSIVASVRLSRPQATVGRSWRGLGFRRAVGRLSPGRGCKVTGGSRSGPLAGVKIHHGTPPAPASHQSYVPSWKLQEGFSFGNVPPEPSTEVLKLCSLYRRNA